MLRRICGLISLHSLVVAVVLMLGTYAIAAPPAGLSVTLDVNANQGLDVFASWNGEWIDSFTDMDNGQVYYLGGMNLANPVFGFNQLAIDTIPAGNWALGDTIVVTAFFNGTAVDQASVVVGGP